MTILQCRVATGLEDVSKYPDLFDKLAIESESHVAWSRQDLRNLAGENMIRVMVGVENYRDAAKVEELRETIIPEGELHSATCRVLPAGTQ